VPKAVVGRALELIAQRFVRFVDLFEAGFGIRRFIHVWMKLACLVAEGALDLRLVGATRHAQYFVIIAFGCQRKVLLTSRRGATTGFLHSSEPPGYGPAFSIPA
jgi:hypothetical protein